jgi:GNAT superfamily N-acetyltransferase
VKGLVYFGWYHESISLSEEERVMESDLLDQVTSLEKLKEKVTLPEGYWSEFRSRGAGWNSHDIEDVFVIWKEAFPSYLGGTFKRETAEFYLREDDVCVIRNAANKIVGVALADIVMFAYGHGQNFSMADITEVAVHKDELGKGLAIFLYQELLERLTKKGIVLKITEARAACFGVMKAAVKAGMNYGGFVPANVPCSSLVWNLGGENHSPGKFEDYQVLYSSSF